jgi:peroxiredoxin
MRMAKMFGLAWIVAMVSGVIVAGETRTWVDVTGKFRIEAEVVSIADDHVVLRNQQGKESRIPLEKLSAADRTFIEEQKGAKQAAKPGSADEDSSTSKSQSGNAPLLSSKKSKPESTTAADLKLLREIADRFYNDLRNESRSDAKSFLTDEGKKIVDEGQSFLSGLPSPDKGSAALRIGKAKVVRSQAMIPVQVKLDGDIQQTALHLRRIENDWRVFAISAKVGKTENTINFEVSMKPAGAKQSPLETLVGQPIEVTGLTLDGRSISSTGLRGKVVLIDFWATWCGPCRTEIENIAKSYQRYHGSGFEVIGVSGDEDLDELKSFVLENRLPWFIVADHHPQNKLSMGAKFQISSLPTLILIGRDGRVVDVNCRGPALETRLTQLLPQ